MTSKWFWPSKIYLKYILTATQTEQEKEIEREKKWDLACCFVLASDRRRTLHVTININSCQTIILIKFCPRNVIKRSKLFSTQLIWRIHYNARSICLGWFRFILFFGNKRILSSLAAISFHRYLWLYNSQIKFEFFSSALTSCFFNEHSTQMKPFSNINEKSFSPKKNSSSSE